MKSSTSGRVNIITALIHLNEALIFYPRLRKFYKNLLRIEKPVILDVGANKGQTADFFVKIFPAATIHSFEPNHRLYNLLVKKYSQKDNITVHNYGVSNAKGTLTLNETLMDETSTFEELNLDSEYLKKKSRILGATPETIVSQSYDVAVITLADFIKEHKIDHIDVLKIDTEGHEYKCLQGLFGSKPQGCTIDYIQLEQHNNDMYSNKVSEQSIQELLKKNGYTVHKRIKHGFGNFDEVVYKYGA